MKYLYGDSTPSPLETNFLELLRDALDFSVYVLAADDRIRQQGARLRERHALCDATVRGIESFGTIVQETIEGAPRGEAGSALAECASSVARLADQTVKSAIAKERALAAAANEASDAEEATERDGCHAALQTFLAAHVPPTTSTEVHLVGRPAGGYDATTTSESEFGLSWTFEMAAPESSLFGKTVRLERLMPLLEIQAPELSGFFKKAMKVKAQRLDKLVLTEVVDDGTEILMRLRDQGGPGGFDFEVDLDENLVNAVRVSGKGESDTPFDVESADVAKLVELAKLVHVGVTELEGKRLVEATLNDAPFRETERFGAVVEALVETMGPIVREISAHSLAPTELILRRLLANDRREEVFVAKSTLSEKIEPLAPEARAIFEPLGLFELSPKPIMSTAPSIVEEEELEIVRAEIAASRPPAPPSIAPPPMVMPPLPPLPDTMAVAEAAPTGEAPPAAEAAPAGVPAATPSSPEVTASPNRNVVLIGRLKTIRNLVKNGKYDEAYDEYGVLFSDPVFAGYRAEDQRQALKLMVHAKQVPLTTTVRDAHRIAAERVRALIADSNEPADHEILGLCQVVLEDSAAASESFARGLELERARDPQSELCGTLLRRVSEV